MIKKLFRPNQTQDKKVSLPSGMTVYKYFGGVLESGCVIENYDGEIVTISYPLETTMPFLTYVNMVDYTVDTKHTNRIYVEFERLPFRLGQVLKHKTKESQLVITGYRGGDKVSVKFGTKRDGVFLSKHKVYRMDINRLTKFWK